MPTNFEEDIAIKHGVVLVKLDPAMDYATGDEVIAISYRGGYRIRIGHRLWVKDELCKMGCRIIKEI
jgi:predicted transcriptional regulator